MLYFPCVAFIRCPNCGSSSLRSSQLRNAKERFKSFFGVIPFRCRQCSERFAAPIWNLRVARYARCPKCLRLELSTWSEQFYLAPVGTRIFLRLGATPYRCDICRCNFASFRPCKEKFSWRRRREAQAAEASAQAATGDALSARD
jgi:DNA-directed RNA polymerase subunit RPC12/RpoP